MPDPQDKIVHVKGLGVVQFPHYMSDDQVLAALRKHTKKTNSVTTESSEHARQLKQAQPLSTALPSIPDWANKPFVSDKDLEETPQGKAITVKSQKEFESSHPQITAAINKGNNPVVLGALKGANEFVRGMETPASMALLLGAPESKILSGIFSIQALRGSYKDAQSAKKAFDEGKNEEAIKYVTQALLGAGVGALAGTHAYSGLPEGVRTKLASEEGSMALPNPTTAYKAVDQSQPFYLKSENLIQDKMKGPMPAEDVHKMLLSNGVKPEEMQWTGLDELLKGKGKSKVTPQEIQEHLAGNNLQIHEVMKGSAEDTAHRQEMERIVRESDDDEDREAAQQELNRMDTAVRGESPKFGSYVIPGGENYRELLLTMPPKTAPQHFIAYKGGPTIGQGYANLSEAQSEMADLFPNRDDIEIRQGVGDRSTTNRTPENFRSSHWDEPNTLGHIRFNDRKGPNGEKILHIEELQSDWHQSARKYGYKDQNLDSELAKTKEEEEKATSAMQAARTEAAKNLREQSPDLGVHHLKTILDYKPSPEELKQLEAESPRLAEYYRAEAARIDAAKRAYELEDRQRKGAPDAPFKKTWPGLMLKRMIQYAATHGYDGISWTPGEEQADRYDLSKQVSRITYAPVDGTLRGYDLNGGQVITENAEPHELENYIGKDAAQKLIEKSEQYKQAKEDAFNGKPFELMHSGKMHTVTVVPDRVLHQGSVLESMMVTDGTNRWHEPIRNIPPLPELTGLDLKVGGTGMKGFYDKIIPDAANKLGKQWGAKVGEMRLGAPQSTIDALKQEADAKYEVWSKLKNDAERHTGYVYGSPESSAVDEAYDAWGEALDKYKEAKTRPEYKVPYLPLHPQMRAGIKSVPYSLFGVGGVALGLNAVKQKADELQRKFRESGLAQ